MVHLALGSAPAVALGSGTGLVEVGAGSDSALDQVELRSHHSYTQCYLCCCSLLSSDNRRTTLGGSGTGSRSLQTK
eukprot:COSAG02_NODE_3341_length_6900_cov_19.222173_7_plen_76_part_00